MSNFIEVHQVNGLAVFINVNSIHFIFPEDGRTKIATKLLTFEVLEPYQHILTEIKKVQGS